MYPRGNKIAPSRWCNTFTDALANWSTSVPSPRHAISSSFASISFVCLYWLQHNNRVQKKTLELLAWTVGIVLSTHRERFHCSALHSQIEQNRVNFYHKVHIRNTVMDYAEILLSSSKHVLPALQEEACLNAQALKRQVAESQKLAEQCKILSQECARLENECALYNNDREVFQEAADEAEDRAALAEQRAILAEQRVHALLLELESLKQSSAEEEDCNAQQEALVIYMSLCVVSDCGLCISFHPTPWWWNHSLSRLMTPQVGDLIIGLRSRLADIEAENQRYHCPGCRCHIGFCFHIVSLGDFLLKIFSFWQQDWMPWLPPRNAFMSVAHNILLKWGTACFCRLQNKLREVEAEAKVLLFKVLVALMLGSCWVSSC